MSIYFDFKTIRDLTGEYCGEEREFTMEELSQYDGRNGNPAYVAIEGIVYDMSNEPTLSRGMHFGMTAGKDLTEQLNSCHGMIQSLNNAPKVGIITNDNDTKNMNFGFTTSMNRQVKPNTANFRPDDWIRYISPLVNYALRESNQGMNMQRSYQKFILLGVLVGLGRTPQEAINQVEEWQKTGASQLLKSTGTGTGMGITGTSGGMGTEISGGMGTGGVVGTGTSGGMGSGGGIGTGIGGGMGSAGGTSIGNRNSSNRLYFD